MVQLMQVELDVSCESAQLVCGQYSSKSGLMTTYSWVPLCSYRVRESGSLGRHQNVRCSCGWWLIKGAGLQTAWHGVVCSTLRNARFTTKKMRPLIIY
jgi:hypothetical protein